MKSEYEPADLEQAVAYLIEECGEVLAAAGKTLRWGFDSFNPELPIEERETNRDWLLREMKDLAGAVKRVRTFLADEVEVSSPSAKEMREQHPSADAVDPSAPDPGTPSTRDRVRRASH